MSERTFAAAIAAPAVAVLIVVLGGTVLLGGTAAGLCSPVASNTATPVTGAAPEVTGFDAEQITNATTIVGVGADLGVPLRGWIIAVAVAVQESSLRNLAHGDSAGPDSLGLFQQRPGWGPASERLNPATAARLFYTGGPHQQPPGLLDIPDWQNLPLETAAHAVQHNSGALTARYATHERVATALVAAITGASDPIPLPGTADSNPGGCTFGSGDALPDSMPQTVPAGFRIPTGTSPQAAAAITWALRQLGTPYSYGGDCTAAHSGIRARQCDCSSLVQEAFKAAGVPLPRTTSEQVHAGSPVTTLKDLHPGDLVFIPGSDGTHTKPGHVALYIGDGLLLHAPKTGENVTLAQLRTWIPMVAAMRRVTTAPNL